MTAGLICAMQEVRLAGFALTIQSLDDVVTLGYEIYTQDMRLIIYIYTIRSPLE